MADAARTTVIEGRKVLIVDRPRPIPGSLQLLLEGGRDATGRPWSPIRVVIRDPLRLGGARPECLRNDHNLRRWVEGFHTGSDSAVRYLSLQACADCGAVCVRDRSFDTLDGLPPAGRRPLRRRDEVIGWYSGARRNGRTYS